MRRFIQFPIRYRAAQSAPSSTAPPWQTTLLINISENGLFMTGSERLSNGSLLDIQFELPASRERIEAVGRVLRLNTVQEGMIYEYGVQFIKISSPQRKRLAAFAAERDTAA